MLTEGLTQMDVSHAPVMSLCCVVVQLVCLLILECLNYHGLVAYTSMTFLLSSLSCNSLANSPSQEVSWLSKKKASIVQSSTEAEYVAASIAAQEAIWLRELLGDLKFYQEQPTIIQEDNQGAIAMLKNPKFHGRMKHIDIKCHFVRDKVENNEIMLKYCQTKDMVADTFTKALPKSQFERFRLMLGMSYKV